MAETVGARLHPDLVEWLEEHADELSTTKARLVEDAVRRMKEDIEAENTDESLPEGVYVPDSDKYEYAVRWEDRRGNTRREYYKTREGAIKKAERER